MRICTITCQNADNYGARLQAYALAEYLKCQGHDVRVIDYRPPYMTFKTQLWYWPGVSLKQWAKLFVRMRQRSTDIKRHEAFCAFSDKYLPLTKVYHGIDELRKNTPKADLYIAGSDQIWNTVFANGTDPAYYLDFGDTSTSRISYAASFATESIVSDKIPFVKEKLKCFDRISVRESSAIHLLKSLGRADGKLVLDPVFLISANDWDKLLPLEHYDEEYILVYDFMQSKTIRKVVMRLADLTNCKIFAIGARMLRYADKSFTTADPTQFISLVKHSRCVVSNSFHGTAFAMIYHRDFFVVNREDGLNERMVDWLNRCNLRERLITAAVSDVDLVSSIDYHKVSNIITKEIVYSKDFLKESVNIAY